MMYIQLMNMVKITSGSSSVHRNSNIHVSKQHSSTQTNNCFETRLINYTSKQVTLIDGTRVFNCQLFPASEAVGEHGMRQLVDNALAWIDRPWTLTDGGRAFPTNERYGHNACVRSPSAFENFQALEAFAVDFQGFVVEHGTDWLKAHHEQLVDRLSRDEDAARTQEEEDAQADEDAARAQEDEDATAAEEAAAQAAEAATTAPRAGGWGQRKRPQPPAGPPTAEHRAAAQAAATVRAQPAKAAGRAPPAPPPPPPAAPPAAAASAAGHEPDAAAPRAVPAWARQEFDVTAWWGVLEKTEFAELGVSVMDNKNSRIKL